MRSLPDFDHADDGEAFREAVADLFDAVDVAFVEGVNTSWPQKHHRDEVLTALANDRAALVDADRARRLDVAADVPRSGHVVVTEDGEALTYPEEETLDGWLAVVEAVAESDSLDRVDTGPAHDGVWPGLVQKTFEVQNTPSEERDPGETRLLAASVRLRDENWARYLDELAAEGEVDLDDAGLVIGRFHAPQRLVAADHDVTPVDDPRGGAPSETAARAAARHVLRSSDAGHALLGDPATVAETLGAEGAQARLAALGAALCTESRLWGGDPGDALAAYDEAVTTALAADDPPATLDDGPPAAAGLTPDDGTVAAAFDGGPAREAERVRRLQDAARGPLAALVDLDAAVDYGDLDPEPPETAPSTAAVVAGAVPEDGVGPETVRPLLDDDTCTLARGALRPQKLASLRAVAYGGRHQRVGDDGFAVEPLAHEPETATVDLAREVADLAAALPDLDVAPTVGTVPPLDGPRSAFGRLRDGLRRVRGLFSADDGGRDADALAPGGPAAVPDLAAELAAPGASLDAPLADLTAGDAVTARVAGAFRGVARAQAELLPDERLVDRVGESTPDDRAPGGDGRSRD